MLLMGFIPGGGSGAGAKNVPVARGAYTSDEQITGIQALRVIAEFDLDEAPVTAFLDGIVLVSQVALVGSIYLYDVVAGATVAGSTLSTSSIIGARLTSPDLTAALVVGRRYQIRATCTGGTAQNDWALARYATLVPG